MKMIAKQEAGSDTQKTKLVQPMISSFFTPRKNDSSISRNKSNVYNIPKNFKKETRQLHVEKHTPVARKARKSRPINEDKTNNDNKTATILKSTKVLSQNDNRSHCFTRDIDTFIKSEADSTTSPIFGNSFFHSTQLFSPNGTHTMNRPSPQEIQKLAQEDKNVSIVNGYITINVDDSDNEEENVQNKENRSKSQEVQRKQAEAKESTTPTKRARTTDGNPSPSKVIRSDSAPDNSSIRVRKNLFHVDDTDADPPDESVQEPARTKETNQLSENFSSIFDEDTSDINLQEYGLNVQELESYSPSINVTNVNHFDLSSLNKSTDKIDVKIEQTNSCEEGIKAEPNDESPDLDATILCGPTSEIHSQPQPPTGAIKIASEDIVKPPTASTSTQTIKIFPINNPPKEKTEDEVVKTDLDQFHIQKLFAKLWDEIQVKPQVLDLMEDRHRLAILFALDSHHQEVCTRLFTRRTKWQRQNKFFEGIKLHLNTTTQELLLTDLEQLGYVHRNFETSESLETVLNHLQLPELKRLTKYRMKLQYSRKSDMIQALVKFVAAQPSIGKLTTEETLRKSVCQLVGTCFRVDDDLRTALFRLQVMHHCAIPDITSHYEYYTYLSDIDSGRVVLPKYNVHDVCAFANKDAFNRYASVMELYFDYHYQKERRKAKNKLNELKTIADEVFERLKKSATLKMKDVSPVHQRFTAEYVCAKILTLAATDLTKSAQDVVEWLMYLLNSYPGTKKGEWYDRLAMHFQKQKDFHVAAEIINKGLSNDDVCNVDKIALSVRAQAMIKTKKLPESCFKTSKMLLAPMCEDIPHTVIEAQPLKVKVFKSKRLEYEEDGEWYNVEEIAMRYYARNGYPEGIHCEGTLLMTLFTALFWDVIYCDLPNESNVHVFISPLQYIPLDMFSKDFYRRRKVLIDARLDDIATNWSDDEFFHRLWEFHVQNSHVRSLHDPRLSGEVAVEAATCIGRGKLRKMLERVVKDPRQYRAGMPDLFVWNNKEKKCCFVEVKSHNDVLSMKQKLWLEFLQEIEVPVELCRVNSIGEKVPKSRTNKD